MKGPLKIDRLTHDGQAVFDVLNEQLDLAASVVGASYLDSALATMLHARMCSGSVTDGLLSPNGPLGTFSARTDLAYGLGLVSKEDYQDLRHMSQIRNRFAHSHLQLSFADAPVQGLCSELKAWRILHWRDAEPTDEPEKLRMAARNKFNLSVVLISQRLLLTGLAEEKRPKEK